MQPSPILTSYLPTYCYHMHLLIDLSIGHFNSIPSFATPLGHSPPSLHHFVMQGLLPPVVVLGCGVSFARV